MPDDLKPFPKDPTALQTGSPPLEVPGADPGKAAIGSPSTPTIPMPTSPAETPQPAIPPASTPLLDAEIRRVEDVTRQHSESLRTGESNEPLPGAFMIVPASPNPDRVESKQQEPAAPINNDASPSVQIPARLVEPAPLPIALLPAPGEAPVIQPAGPGPIAADRQGMDSSGTKVDETAGDPPPPIPPEPKPDSLPEVVGGKVESPVRPEPAESLSRTWEGEAPAEPRTPRRPARQEPRRPEDPPSGTDTETSARDREQQPALTIAELKLCRKVDRFGSFEAMDTSALKPGRSVLVYCEIAGLEYRPHSDQFLSRLSSHLELRSEGGTIVWDQALPTAEDVCRRPRHDYFVWYRITLPASLRPGSYRLRLIETDLIAESTTSAEVPLSIAD
jgi:hypothetical protein